jgi:hypothetical protein
MSPGGSGSGRADFGASLSQFWLPHGVVPQEHPIEISGPRRLGARSWTPLLEVFRKRFECEDLESRFRIFWFWQLDLA